MTRQARAAVTRRLSSLQIPEAFALATLASAVIAAGKPKRKREFRRLDRQVAKLEERGEL